nr:hypothetical protein Iba_chr13aCG4510 [Ipomoea batatas]
MALASFLLEIKEQKKKSNCKVPGSQREFHERGYDAMQKRIKRSNNRERKGEHNPQEIGRYIYRTGFVDDPHGVQIRKTHEDLISVKRDLAFRHLPSARFYQALQGTAGGVFEQEIVHQFAVAFQAGVRAVAVNKVGASSQGI